MALGLMVCGLMLTAAALDPSLPSNYWDAPKATAGAAPHAWSKLEKDLRPEACAQCHSEQFDDWKGSLHAAAYSPGTVGQFPDMGHGAANACLNCHAPLAEQKFSDDESMHRSVALLLKQKQGFDSDANLDGKKVPLTHAGVSCAACHVRGWKRFGPPPKASGAVGIQAGSAHGGFTATRDFESSQFCASCHQFPDSMAINGKPLENTVTEWKESSFAKQGVTCQQCHMPDRKHEFRGIHDPQMVKKGLSFDLKQQGEVAIFAITSTWIGHAFPTYVTPKVIVRAEAKNSDGESLKSWQWEIVREVEYDNGWQEIRDTRLMPGETRKYITDGLPSASDRVRFSVNVIPDNFYKGLYESLLAGEQQPAAKVHIRRARAYADKNDYLLFEQSIFIE